MQAVILCGGLGTRLRPVTATVPKGLVEVAGRPFLEIQLEDLARGGVEEVVLLTGYLGEMIEQHFGPGGGNFPRIIYSREPEPLGTGGALKLAAPYLSREFLLVNGDTYLPLDYRKIMKALAHFSGIGVLSAFPAQGTPRIPNLRLDDNDVLTGYSRTGTKEQGYTCVDAGVGAFSRRLLDFFSEENKFALEEKVYPRLIACQELRAVITPVDFFDIGTPERLVCFENYLKSR